jgi:hypothetical protein
MSERYLKIVKWLRKRYTRNGRLIVDVAGGQSKYKRIETLAWLKYMNRGLRWIELDDGQWELFYVSRSGILAKVDGGEG